MRAQRMGLMVVVDVRDRWTSKQSGRAEIGGDHQCGWPWHTTWPERSSCLDFQHYCCLKEAFHGRVLAGRQQDWEGGVRCRDTQE